MYEFSVFKNIIINLMTAACILSTKMTEIELQCVERKI